MMLRIRNTTKIVELNGVPARVWEGETDSGIPVILFVTRIAVAKADDQAPFERELQSISPPSPEAETFPARMIL